MPLGRRKIALHRFDARETGWRETQLLRLQRQVLRRLCYALKPSGFLILGESETVGRDSPLFDAIDAGHRIYAKRTGTGEGHYVTTTAVHGTSSVPSKAGGSKGVSKTPSGLA